MKKTRLFAVLLATTLVVSAFCACLTVSAKKGDNLAAGKTCDGADPPTEPGSAKYNANLTDGQAADTLTFAENEWFAFYCHLQDDGTPKPGYNAPGKVGTFTIDLGAVSSVGSVRIHTYTGNNAGILPPSAMKVEYSEDNKSFSEFGETKTFTQPETTVDKTEWVEFAPSASVKARYIKVTVNLLSPYAFLNEVQVLEGDPIDGTGTSTPSESTSTPSTSTPSSSTGPAAGDAGLIGFAVLAVVAISGLAVAVKVRK